jgi:electron transport complex protein RnfB
MSTPAQRATPAPRSTPDALAGRIDAVLPQTQCTQCGFAGCRPYAEAIAAGDAPINRCPPGGAEGIARLAALLGRQALALDPECGEERPFRVAWIDEALCIGCTKCIAACPVDAIIGAPKRMHWVSDALCSGCDLCVPACPVDCIEMRPSPSHPAWTAQDADDARERHRRRALRLERERLEQDLLLEAKAVRKLERLAAEADDAQRRRKQAVIEAAMRRARERLDAAR